MKKGYKKEPSGLPTCFDCGKQLKDYRSKRCPLCASKYLAVNYHDLRVQLGKQNGRTSKMSAKAKKRRSKQQSLIRGKLASNWQGGITPLMQLIRNSVESKVWRNTIFSRDNYICQQCHDNTGGNLEAHHKKQFSVIFKEFLHEFSQFSPIDDVETLSRLSLSYAPFWNTDNGITLCKNCHKGLFEMAHQG